MPVTPEQLRLELGLDVAGARPSSLRQRRPGPSRLAFTIDEAASALGISRDHLERHILPELRVIYTGRRRLIPVAELVRWTEQHALAPRVAPRAR